MTNTITTTREQIIEELAGYDPETILCDLPDDDFNTGGDICRALRAAGYDESATTVIGSLHAWRMTRADFVELISGTEDED